LIDGLPCVTPCLNLREHSCQIDPSEVFQCEPGLVAGFQASTSAVACHTPEHLSCRSLFRFKNPDHNGELLQEVTTRSPRRVEATYSWCAIDAGDDSCHGSMKSGLEADPNGQIGTPSTWCISSPGERPLQ
jgi:hypothetical protein